MSNGRVAQQIKMLKQNQKVPGLTSQGFSTGI